MPPVLPGNFESLTNDPIKADDGFLSYRLVGTARLTTTGAIVFPILDLNDQQIAIPASAGDPAVITHVSFSIDRPLVGTNGDVLKLGGSLADVSGWVANSSAVASAALAVQQVVAAIAIAGVSITANVTPQLYLHNGANAAPGGTLALAAGAVPNFLRIPCEIIYRKRKSAVRLPDVILSPAQLKLDSGIT